jgi:dipeptidyl-peptidase 4
VGEIEQQPKQSGSPTNDSFPRQYARTRRFTCGEPRSIQLTDSGLLFLRSRGGSDPVNCLWFVPFVGTGVPLGLGPEILLADPLDARFGDDHELPAAERARRERMREQSSGITAYSIDATGSLAVFVLAGIVWSVTIANEPVISQLTSEPGGYDPRLAPDGKSVAFVADGSLRLLALEPTPLEPTPLEPTPLEPTPTDEVTLAHDHNPVITWGVADFNAAEEFNRYRGFWWAPDSLRLAVCRVDNSPVEVCWIADPANPTVAPVEHRYPFAGTANAEVSLWLIDITGNQVPVQLPDGSDYIVSVRWEAVELVVTVLDRSQQLQQILTVQPDGTTTVVHLSTDPVWLELVPGTPRVVNGQLFHTQETADSRLLARGPLSTPSNLAVYSPATHLIHELVEVNEYGALAVAFDRATGPASHSVIWCGQDSTTTTIAGGPQDPGVHSAAAASGDVVVIRSASVTRLRAEHRVHVRSTDDWISIGSLTSFAEAALVNPVPQFRRAGLRQIPTCVLLPSDPSLRGDGTKLPVLLDPYGGPHAQRVLASRNALASSQWLADQGFAVVIIDGRGTPGVGPEWERSIHLDFAGPALADQVVGLLEAAAAFPQLDLQRVGIRGWSFGGYLAALAVLRRPDVFHCAVVGAPVIDWRLYDTGYTERFLGNPANDDEPYRVSSLLDDAPFLTRPIQLIHGLNDDNVIAAHTLRFSSALLAAGKAHEVLPLSGVTHMTPQEEVAENLLLLQVDFLRRHLGGPTHV